MAAVPEAKRLRALALDKATGLPLVLKTATDIYAVSSESEGEDAPSGAEAMPCGDVLVNAFAMAATDPLLQEALGAPALPPAVNGQRDLALACGAPGRVKKAWGAGSGDVVEAPTLGKLYIGKGRDKTYVQHRNAETNGKMRHLFTINEARCPGDAHRDLAYELRAQIVEHDLGREDAIKLCKMALAKFTTAG